MSRWSAPEARLRVAALQGGLAWLAGLLLGELAAACVAAGLVVGTLSTLHLSRGAQARQEGAARRLLLFYRHERCLRRLLERHIAEAAREVSRG